MLGVAAHVRQRDLVGPPGALHRLAVDDLRAGPALRGPHHDHRPRRARLGVGLGGRLDPRDPVERAVHRGGHLRVDGHRLVALHDDGLVSVAVEQLDQALVADPVEDRRVGDLVAVQGEDRDDGPVNGRVEERVRVPARGQGTRLGLAVADDAEDHEVRVVEGRPEGMDQRIAELAAFVDGSGRLGRDVAADPAGERELAEEALHPRLVAGQRAVHLTGRPLEVRVRDRRRTAVPRPDDPDGVQAALLDDPPGMDVDEVQARGGPPVAQEPGLDVLRPERLAQERVVQEVDLADREVVRGAPVGVDPLEIRLAHRSTVVDPGGRWPIGPRVRHGSSPPRAHRPDRSRVRRSDKTSRTNTAQAGTTTTSQDARREHLRRDAPEEQAADVGATARAEHDDIGTFGGRRLEDGLRGVALPDQVGRFDAGRPRPDRRSRGPRPPAGRAPGRPGATGRPAGGGSTARPR